MAGVYLGHSEILAVLNDLDSIGKHSCLPLALSNLRSKLSNSLEKGESSAKVSGTVQPQQEPLPSLGPRFSPEESADEEATLRGTPSLSMPSLSTPGPEISDLSSFFPAGLRCSDPEEGNSDVCAGGTYSSAGRGKQDKLGVEGRTGKDARIRKGKVSQVLRIRGGAEKLCPRGGRSARPNQDKRTRAQIRRANRLGPEGLGDQNDVDVVDDSQEEGGENETFRCNQGSGASVPVPEEPILSIVAVNVISALASVARDCIQQSAASGIISNVHAVAAALRDPDSTFIPEPQSSSISLAVLAKRCKNAELLEACAHLSYWLSVLSFACQMSRWVLLRHTLTAGFSLSPL